MVQYLFGFMFLKTVRWGLRIAVVLLAMYYSAPTAFAETIMEIPRSDARIFCADDLTSSPLVSSVHTETAVPSMPLPQVKPNFSVNADTLFSIVNNYRTSIGLPPFEKDSVICDIAKKRGPELDREVETGTIHAGFYALNLPYWATENMKYGGNEQEMFNWWLNSPIHRNAIEGNYKYSCGECFGHSCNQIFTNYQQK